MSHGLRARLSMPRSQSAAVRTYRLVFAALLLTASWAQAQQATNPAPGSATTLTTTQSAPADVRRSAWDGPLLGEQAASAPAPTPAGMATPSAAEGTRLGGHPVDGSALALPRYLPPALWLLAPARAAGEDGSGAAMSAPAGTFPALPMIRPEPPEVPGPPSALAVGDTSATSSEGADLADASREESAAVPAHAVSIIPVEISAAPVAPVQAEVAPAPRAVLRPLLATSLSPAARSAIDGVQAQFEAAIVGDNARVATNLLLFGEGGVRADPNASDAHGTPLIVRAAQQRSWAVVEVLLRAPRIALDAASPRGETALMIASLHGQTELVRQFIERGAVVNRPGWTALHYAASASHPGNTATVALLLEHHAYIDAASPNESTPLMLAAQYGSQGTVELLLESGADVQLRNQLGLNAVDFARRSERDFMVRLLQQALAQASSTQPRSDGRW